MADRLNIARGLNLPLSSVTVTEAIVGIRGSGKTNTAVVEAEELLEHGQQIVVIDPTDVWWGLKSSKDGERAGYPVVILGGRHQDLQLAAGDGATIADFVVDEGVSVILSLRHFESKADVRRFITDFALRLYFRKGQVSDPTPVKVFIDEASLVVPQRIMGEEARMVGAIQQLVRQGRSSGIGVSLIDQRPATINKDVLTQLELLVAHRITSPQDRKALVAWVEQHDVQEQGDKFLETLAALEQGEAWFWSPGWLDLFKRVHVRERRTFDSSRTPKPGERVAAPTKVAAVDLEALKAKLSTSIEKARAEDPRELRKEIVRLEKELRQLQSQKAVVDPDAIAKATQAGREAFAREFQNMGLAHARSVQKAIELLAHAGEIIRDVANNRLEPVIEFLTPNESLEWTSTSPSSPRPAVPTAVTAGQSGGPITRSTLGASTPARPQVSQRADRAVIAGDGHIGGTGRRILNALAFFEETGNPEPGDNQVAGLVGISAKTGSWASRKSELRTAGYVEDVARGVMRLTNAGRKLASTDGLPRSRAELHEYWIAKVGGTAGKMLRVLVDAYPDAMEKSALAGMVGISHETGSFASRLSEIRTPGLIEDVSRSEVRASAMLFPDGLR